MQCTTFSVLCAVYYVQYIVYSASSAVYCVKLFIEKNSFVQCVPTVLCAVYYMQCIVCTELCGVLCSVHCVQLIVFSLLCAVHCAEYFVSSVQY